MWNYHTTSKGLLMEANTQTTKFIYNSGDTALVGLFNDWKDQKRYLLKLYTFSDEELKDQKINLSEEEQKANNLEKDLTAKVPNVNVVEQTPKLTELVFALPEEAGVVELLRLNKFHGWDTEEIQYAALVINPDAQTPKLVHLKNGKDLEKKFYNYYHVAIENQLEDEYSYKQYWAPIDKAFKGKSLFYSPDGVYHQINISGLKDETGQFITEKYQVRQIGSTRIFNARETAKTDIENVALLGDPDFQSNGVPRLPGTEKEVEEIARLLKTYQIEPKKYIGKTAEEKAIKELDNPGVLHIATHGYFLEDADQNPDLLFGISPEKATDNPMLRAGLLFSNIGGTAENNQQVGYSIENNGVLTAWEAVNIPLQDTRLVVLSACETGKGEIRAGEGIYGLQKAFFSAGAKNLLMSLWKVDDEATQQFMVSFYTDFVKNQDAHKAIQFARAATRKAYPAPYYWAAFILVEQGR
jgi:CHAT domain-containing protein